MSAHQTPLPLRTTRSTCCYCGTGCGVLIDHDGQRILGVRGDPEHPANFGRLCPKGSSLHQTTFLEGRLLTPSLRRTRHAVHQAVSWDIALDHCAERFAALIRQHGPDSVAFYVSGQLLTEDYYVFNKLARAVVGTNHIDSNSRLCMSSAVSAYKRTLGADAPPCCYEDLEQAHLVLIAGANPAWAHPILFRRLMDARAAQPGHKLIVIDPRRTETAAAADLHLAIQPGSDAILLSAMLNVMIQEKAIDPDFIHAHTQGFSDLKEQIKPLTPMLAARLCGVSAGDIVTAALWFAESPAALSLWCQGLNQSHHGSDNGAALIHLHLATGQIGRPGSGPFSLTGQPNAMGGRETGTMATLLPGHRDPNNPADWEELRHAWGLASWPISSIKEQAALPLRPGNTATELFDGLAEGRIKAVWIACTNPAHSMPDQARVRHALQQAEFVVLQEAFTGTETSEFADVLLPAASWGEKSGTVTNSERRMTRIEAPIPPPGEARPDWAIACDFGQRLSRLLNPPKAGETVPPSREKASEAALPPPSRGRAGERENKKSLLAFQTSADIFAEYAGLTAGRDLDISALTSLDPDALHRLGPQQWPYSAGHGGTARLYTDLRFATPDGKARFVPLQRSLTAEDISARYPMRLNTGRLRDQWHGMSRTGRLARLYQQANAWLALHPQDMERLQLTADQLARITSRRGSVILPVQPDPSLQPGHTFIPMHWGRRTLSHAGSNELIAAVVDPLSGQPELKHAAIRIEAAALVWQGSLHLAFDRHDDAAADHFLRHATPLLKEFDFAAISRQDGTRQIISLRLAHHTAAPQILLERLEQLAGLADTESSELLSFDDPGQHFRKRARLDGEGCLQTITLWGETAARHWTRELMRDAVSMTHDPGYRRYLFAPCPSLPISSQGNNNKQGRGAILCQCMDVAEADLQRQWDSRVHDFEALRRKLGFGGGCGGCVPEIRKRVANLK